MKKVNRITAIILSILLVVMVTVSASAATYQNFEDPDTGIQVRASVNEDAILEVKLLEGENKIPSIIRSYFINLKTNAEISNMNIKIPATERLAVAYQDLYSYLPDPSSANVSQFKRGAFALNYVPSKFDGENILIEDYNNVGIFYLFKPIWGDANLDNVLNIEDASLIQKFIVLNTKMFDNQKIVADYNGDGIINVLDVTAIQRIVAFM